MEEIDKMNCVVCDREIIQFEEGFGDKPWEGCWSDGAVQVVTMGYGSRLDGDMYLLCICDRCIKRKYSAKKIRYKGDYLTPGRFPEPYFPEDL